MAGVGQLDKSILRGKAHSHKTGTPPPSKLRKLKRRENRNPHLLSLEPPPMNQVLILDPDN